MKDKCIYAKLDYRALISRISIFKPVQLDYIDSEILSNIHEQNYNSYDLKEKFKNSIYQRDYSKIRNRIKNLEASNLIERTGEVSKRNAINYKITTLGLIYLYANIQNIVFSDILRYNKDILFNTLIFQFFEKQTIINIYTGDTNNNNTFNKLDDNEDLEIIYNKMLQSSTCNIDNEDYTPPLIEYLLIDYLRNCCKIISKFCTDFFIGLSKSKNQENPEYRFRGVKLPNDHIIQAYIEYLDDDQSNLVIDQTIIDEIQRYQIEVKRMNKIEQKEITERLKKENEGRPQNKRFIVSMDTIRKGSSKEASAEYFNAIKSIGYESMLFPNSKLLDNGDSPSYPLNFNRIYLGEQLEWEIKSFVLKIITKNLPFRFSHSSHDLEDEYLKSISFLLRDNKFKLLAERIKGEFDKGSELLNI